MKKFLFLGMSLISMTGVFANEIEDKKESAKVSDKEEVPTQVCCHSAADRYVRERSLHVFMNATAAEQAYQDYYNGCVAGGGNGSFYCN